MKKKLFVGIILILTIIYAVVGVVLFSDIQVLKAPETTITLQVLEMNESEGLVFALIHVVNPNSFDVITKDFRIVLLAEHGGEIGRAELAGDLIGPYDHKNFSVTVPIGFQESEPGTLQTELSGVIGVNMFGVIRKTVPFAITIITSIDDLLEQLQPPSIILSVDCSDLTDHGVNISGDFEVYNPNSFDLIIDDFSSEMITENGDVVGNIHVNGGVIPGKETTVLTGTGQIGIEVLNAKTVTMNTLIRAGVKAAGLEKMVDVDVQTRVTMPSLHTLISSEKPLDLIIYGDYRITLNGVLVNVTLEINNPHNITLLAKDLSVTIYEVKNNEKHEIGYGIIDDGVVPPHETLRLNGIIELPKTRLLTLVRGMLSSDWISTTVQGNLTVPGLETGIWFGISGYEDLHPFR
ncbi:MAG: hypothetical protein V1726_08150 [Methanobacteriota archaeon]